MALTTYVKTPKSQLDYLYHTQIDMSRLAQKAIENCVDDWSTEMTHEIQYGGEMVQTGVSITLEHANIIDVLGLDLSQLIRDDISQKIRQERKLQEAENNPGDGINERERYLMDHIQTKGLHPKE